MTLFRYKPLIASVLAAAVLLTWAAASTASASETRSYVLSSFADAAYSTKDDCAGGIDPDQTVQYALDLEALGMPEEQVKKLMAGYP
ncbi:MAG: hypothetical protein ACRETK_06835, partial [Steroidobacteraceae bacterium]